MTRPTSNLKPVIVEGVEYRIISYCDSLEIDTTDIRFAHPNGHEQYAMCIAPARIKDIENAIVEQVRHLATLNYKWERRARFSQGEVRRLREALQFYARHEHWMEQTSDSGLCRLLVAMQGVGIQHGWIVAEIALTTPPYETNEVKS